MNEGDPFSAIRHYRLAARSIARDESLGGKRFPALVRLVERSQEEFGKGSWLALTIQRIVFAESEELLLHGRTPRSPAPSWCGDPVVLALFHLLRKGYASCPTCLRAIPPAETLAHWEDESRRLWAGAFRREQAAGKTHDSEPGGDAA